MAESVILSEFRLFNIRHGKLQTNILREDMRAVRRGPSKSLFEQLLVTLQDGSEASVPIYSGKVCNFLIKVIQPPFPIFNVCAVAYLGIGEVSSWPATFEWVS